MNEPQNNRQQHPSELAPDGQPLSGQGQTARKLPRILREKLTVEERYVKPAARKALYLTALLLAFFGAVFFFLDLGAVLRQDDLAALDRPVDSWFVTQRSEPITAVMVVLSIVFGPVAMPVIVLVVTLVWTVAARHAWRPLLLAAAMLTGVILTQLIAHAVSRHRPPIRLMLLGPDITSSFPSGHVLGAANFLLVGAFLVFSRSKRIRTAVSGFLAAAAGVAVQAVSRLYLGYHWLTDTLASVSLALVILGAVIALDTWRTARVPGEPATGQLSTPQQDGT
jgi:undecaprenyl-diphosphatase